MYKVASFKILSGKYLVNLAAQESGIRFSKHGRFESSIDYFLKTNHEFWKEIPNADINLREEYVNHNSTKRIRWVGRKTFSLWHQFLGGKELLALDVWVMKRLNKLGIEIDEDYIIPKRRTPKSQKNRLTPSKEDYLRIEREAYEIFSQDKRFLLPDERVDMTLVDAVLWWKGANRGSLNQYKLFDNGSTFPYSKKH